MQVSMDKKYKTKSGDAVRILCVDSKHPTYPVVALVDDDGDDVIHSYTSSGKFCSGSISEADLIEVPEWGDFKLDDKVLVRDSEQEDWVRRYFSHVGDDGHPYTFQGGLTSWSNDDCPIGWKFCKKAEV